MSLRLSLKGFFRCSAIFDLCKQKRQRAHSAAAPQGHATAGGSELLCGWQPRLRAAVAALPPHPPESRGSPTRAARSATAPDYPRAAPAATRTEMPQAAERPHTQPDGWRRSPTFKTQRRGRALVGAAHGVTRGRRSHPGRVGVPPLAGWC